MINLSVTPPRTRQGEKTLTSCLNLPGVSTTPSRETDTKPVIELSKCKDVSITNLGNRYEPDSYIPNINRIQLDPYFLIGCVILLVILMILIIIVSYWTLNRSKTCTIRSKSNKKFLKFSVYVSMLVIFIVILFLFYLILRF